MQQRISTGVHKLFSLLMEGFFTHSYTHIHTHTYIQTHPHMEQQRHIYSFVSAGVQLEIFNICPKQRPTKFDRSTQRAQISRIQSLEKIHKM